MPRPRAKIDHTCPHINLDDPRCARHFRLGSIGEAFDLCLSAYLNCPLYHQIRQEREGEPATTQVTVKGSQRQPVMANGE